MNAAKLRQIIGWSLIGLLLLWIALNFRSATVHLLIGEVSMPVAFVIILSAAAGAGAVFAFQYLKKYKKSDDSPKG